MKKNYIYVLFVLFAAFLTGCGEGKLDISEAKYEPKIVMEGYVYPGKNVENIKISRNFPLNADLDFSNMIIADANVIITDLENNKAYKLFYNSARKGYDYNGNDLKIEYSHGYKIDVYAKIDGKDLHASSTTTTPMDGLKILNAQNESYKYKDVYTVKFSTSANGTFYAASITATNPSLNDFIYDNDFGTKDTVEIKKNWDRYRQEYNWLQNVLPGTPQTSIDILWHQTWFYGKYRLIIYCGDKNFHHFMATHKDVQEIDGNFHEPKMYIEGDGIGVFGSATADTLYFNLSR